jgi:hypothetical protein
MEEFYFANLIRQTLEKLNGSSYDDLLCHASALLEKSTQAAFQLRRLQKALSRNWMNAARRCRNLLEIALGDVPYRLSCLERAISTPEPSLPSLKDLIGEMDQITEELGDIHFDRKKRTMSITTEPITLEGVFLGDFEIRLEVDKIAEICKCRPYAIIALDPHPAAASSEVTHPHVSEQVLCEGDGSAAIHAALSQGRLFDFFSMVTSILKTYNPGSPYVKLEDWNGSCCYDCGTGIYEDDRYFCESCGNDFCECCSTCCRSCNETTCLSCGSECSICEERICKNCVRKCKECGNVCCEYCMKDGICNACIEEIENEQSEQQTPNDNLVQGTESAATAVASVLPDGLGQAAVLPGQNSQ